MTGRHHRWARAGWIALIVSAFFARPWSCGVALHFEQRPAANPYRSIDPHSFGLMGAIVSALLFAIPVLWLLLQPRPNAGLAAGTRLRITTLAVVGTPMLLQLGYLRLPIAASWPVYAASLCWFGCVAIVCFGRGASVPSIDGAYARAPHLAWTVVIATLAAKAGVLLLTLR